MSSPTKSTEQRQAVVIVPLAHYSQNALSADKLAILAHLLQRNADLHLG